MKKSLVIVISLILACLMIMTSCNSTSAPQAKETSNNGASEVQTETERLMEALTEAVTDAATPEVETPEVEIPKAEAPEAEDNNADVSLPEADEPTVEPEVDEKIDFPEEEIDFPEEDEVEEEIELEGSVGDEVFVGSGSLSKSYKGTMNYKTTDGKSKTCSVDFVVDYEKLITGDNTVYSKDISKLSILMASDIYKNLYIKFTSGATGGSDTSTTFGKKIGLSDVKAYSISSADYSVDKDDITDFVVGHKKISYNGKTYEVIMVSVRGTNDTTAEWSSNFDVGADTRDYYSIMGNSHPDWKNKLNHKGFDVTANRVYDKLAAYIKSYVASNSEVSILLTGHSRGAAIANILGQMYEDNTSYKVFGYTFASPNTTTATNAGKYKSIFNVVNSDDIIPYLPLSEWGFTKYGITKTVSVKSNYNGNASTKGTFKWFTGLSYNDDGGKQRTIDCFAALAKTRADLYKLDTSSDGKFYYAGNLSLGYSEKDAQKQYNTLTTDLKNQNLLKFCKVSIVEGGKVWKYRVEVNYCPAYFMQMLANMTTGVGPLLGQDLTGKYNDAKLSFIASSGKVVVGGMEHPHMQPTYYLIAENDFKALKK